LSSVVKSGVKAHDDACLLALGTLQAAIAGVTSQATVNSAYVTFHTTCFNSAKTNGLQSEAFRTALRQLGQYV
jgi:hypothetical protein